MQKIEIDFKADVEDGGKKRLQNRPAPSQQVFGRLVGIVLLLYAEPVALNSRQVEAVATGDPPPKLEFTLGQ